MTKMVMIVDMDACSGCQACVTACSLAKANVFSPTKSSISVRKVESRCLSIPVLCEHCDNLPCQAVCPTGAISRDPDTGIVVIDPDLCGGCENCRWACPFGGPLTIKMEDGVAVKCDLCEGSPACAEVCHQGAIAYMPASPSAVHRKWRCAEERMKALLSLAVRRAM